MSLTDEQIEALDCVDLIRECYEVFSVDRASVQTFARRIESATAAPLLERIGQLEVLRSEELAHAIGLAAIITDLEQQLEAARKDAERYRWIRHGDNDETLLQEDCRGVYLPRSEYLDAAIDAAISKEQAAPQLPPFFTTPKQRGELAGDGKPCNNDHSPDCRWPTCVCREREAFFSKEQA